MPKRQTNNLKWNANLMMIGETIDPDTDRVIVDYLFNRKLKYSSIGVTATDRHFSYQDGNEVVKKIETRLDRAIEAEQKDYRIKIGDIVYDIERLYVREQERMMELSLAHAN